MKLEKNNTFIDTLTNAGQMGNYHSYALPEKVVEPEDVPEVVPPVLAEIRAFDEHEDEPETSGFWYNWENIYDDNGFDGSVSTRAKARKHAAAIKLAKKVTKKAKTDSIAPILQVLPSQLPSGLRIAPFNPDAGRINNIMAKAAAMAGIDPAENPEALQEFLTNLVNTGSSDFSGFSDGYGMPGSLENDLFFGSNFTDDEISNFSLKKVVKAVGKGIGNAAKYVAKSVSSTGMPGANLPPAVGSANFRVGSSLPSSGFQAGPAIGAPGISSPAIGAPSQFTPLLSNPAFSYTNPTTPDLTSGTTAKTPFVDTLGKYVNIFSGLGTAAAGLINAIKGSNGQQLPAGTYVDANGNLRSATADQLTAAAQAAAGSYDPGVSGAYGMPMAYDSDTGSYYPVQQTGQAAYTPVTAASGKNTMLYVVIGLVVLAVIFVILKKKK